MRSSWARASWIQLNVGLTRHDGEALPSARAVFARLAPLVSRYRRERRLRRFLFVRKPPDVRLRFLGPGLEKDVLPELRRVLEGLRRDGFVRRFFPSVYEPETRQFGGPEAMEHVHAYFDADTAAWVALDRLATTGGRAIPAETLSVAVVNDLFYRTLGCASEVWDAWSNLSEVIRAPGWDGDPPPVVFLEELRRAAAPREAPLVSRYGRANAALVAGLDRVWRRGRLRCGVRVVLPFVALVHFNRHGFGWDRQARLVASMVAAWSPKRGLVGAGVDPTRGRVPESSPA